MMSECIEIALARTLLSSFWPRMVPAALTMGEKIPSLWAAFFFAGAGVFLGATGVGGISMMSLDDSDDTVSVTSATCW